MIKKAKQNTDEQLSPDMVIKSAKSVRKSEGDYGGTIYEKGKF